MAALSMGGALYRKDPLSGLPGLLQARQQVQGFRDRNAALEQKKRQQAAWDQFVKMQTGEQPQVTTYQAPQMVLKGDPGPVQ